MTTTPLAVAHRGYSARYPENTLRAMREAVRAGADVVEMDARLSGDGTVWCLHDADLGRLCGEPLIVAETSSAALREMRTASGEPLATLADGLAALRGDADALIDVKATDVAGALAVLGIVHHAAAVQSVVFGLRSAAQVAGIRKADPDARCLGFVPHYAEAAEFLAAGVFAIRVWEGHLAGAEAAQLLRTTRVWVTAGGYGTASEPGDVTDERLARILAAGPEAILLNDPTLLTRRKSARPIGADAP